MRKKLLIETAWSSAVFPALFISVLFALLALRRCKIVSEKPFVEAQCKGVFRFLLNYV